MLNKDIIRYLLCKYVDDETVLNVLSINKYFYSSIDTKFWINKILYEFPITFNDVLNKTIQITMGSMIYKNIYLYDNRITGEMSFGSYLLSNNVSTDNCEIKLSRFNSNYKLDDYYLLEKYKLYFILFYHIMINK